MSVQAARQMERTFHGAGVEACRLEGPFEQLVPALARAVTPTRSASEHPAEHPAPDTEAPSGWHSRPFG